MVKNKTMISGWIPNHLFAALKAESKACGKSMTTLVVEALEKKLSKRLKNND